MWTEFQAGIECLTQLLLLIDGMASTELSNPDLNDAAEILQNQLIYNGEVLDIALESLRAYKEGTQSLVYLDSSVYLAYALLRMLEKWTKAKGSKEMYVRKKARKRRRKGELVFGFCTVCSFPIFTQLLLKKTGYRTLRKRKSERRMRIRFAS